MALKSLRSAQKGEATWRRLSQICEVAVWLYCVPGNIQCVKLDRGQRLYQIVFCRKDQSIPCNSTWPSRLPTWWGISMTLAAAEVWLLWSGTDRIQSVVHMHRFDKYRHNIVYNCCCLPTSHWISAELESLINDISIRYDTCLRGEGKHY
jgi:hypothetical protein